MKLELEVLASTSIKRKKPWPRLAFMGKVQESLFLLDSQRVSVLYVPSGKTKRKVPRLQPLMQDVVLMTHSDNGQFIGALLRSGNLFLWHKDTDNLKIVEGLPNLVPPMYLSAAGSNVQDAEPSGTHQTVPGGKPYMCVADDGTKILFVTTNYQVFVWELDPHQRGNDPREKRALGTWSQVIAEADDQLPTAEDVETCVHALFCVSQAAGLSCVLSFVRNSGADILVTTVILKWLEPHEIFSFRHPCYVAEWRISRHPFGDISPQLRPVRCPGAFIVCHSHDCQLTAVAVNQLNSHWNTLLFKSVSADAVVSSHLAGVGAREPITRNATSYWLADIRWTSDDLFVVCITGQGSLGMVSRLGEPVLLQTYGNSIEMGPKPFLPLHPLITIRLMDESPEQQTEESALQLHLLQQQDPLCQKFSVTTHPERSVILCSDGYMVTVMQLAGDISCMSLMRGLVLESNGHLRRIKDQQKLQLTLFDNRHQHPSPSSAGAEGSGHARAKQHYRFEADGDDAVNTSQDDLASHLMKDNANMGRIVFGDAENMNTTLDFRRIVQDEGLSVVEHIHRAHKDLFLAWGLAASHAGMWTTVHEETTQLMGQNFVRLFTVLLHCPTDALKELDALSGVSKGRTKSKKRGLVKVLALFKTAMHLLQMDSVSRHLMVCALGFVHSTVELFLNNKALQKRETPSQTLHGCYLLLRYCELVLAQTYAYVPNTSHFSGVNGLPGLSPMVGLSSPSVWSTIVSVSVSESSHTGLSAGPADTSSERALTDATGDGCLLNSEDQKEPQSPTTQPQLGNADLKSVSSSKDRCTTELDSVNRLASTWRMLYKHTVQHLAALNKMVQAQASRSDKKLKREHSQMLQLSAVLQCKLQRLGVDFSLKLTPKVHSGEKSWIEGSPIMALHSWTHFLNTLDSGRLLGSRGGRVLHSMLYTMLLHSQLRAAVQLVEFLIRQGDICKAAALCRQNEETRTSLLSLLQQVPSQEKLAPPELIKSRAVRHAVQSLARLMASYFSNTTMFVHPPHCPRRLPPIHVHSLIKSRVMPLYHKALTSAVRQDGLSSVWTTERALQYLLLSGLYTEAVWFVQTLGDWKVAFLMGVAALQHQKLAPNLYHSKKKLLLPEELQPASILQQQLNSIFWPSGVDSAQGPLVVDESTDFAQLTKTLTDLLLASTICEVDITPWLLTALVGRLKALAQRFTPLVPEGCYLPAPPVYCPQPTPTAGEVQSEAVQREVDLRRETSSVIVLILLVLNSSRTTLPAATWYARKVLDAFIMGLRLRKNLSEEAELDIHTLQESYLRDESSFLYHEDNASVHQVLACFRDLTTVVWMLYARDKLTLKLRQQTKSAQRRISSSSSCNSNTPQVENADIATDKQVTKQCWDTLKWVCHMLPFVHYLGDDTGVLHGVFLAQIIKLPKEQEVAKTLAEHFHDVDDLAPEVQDKLSWIQKEWQAVFITEEPRRRTGKDKDRAPANNSPRGKTLSACYHRYTQRRLDKFVRHRMRTFGDHEEHVFGDYTPDAEAILSAEQNGIQNVGSRAFESTEEFLQFLDIFFAVSFNQVLQSERERENAVPETPLLAEFTKELQDREINSNMHKAITRMHQKQNLNVISIQNPRNLDSPRTSPRGRVTSVSSTPPRPMERKGGLFRSHSLTDLKHSPVRGKPPTPQKRASSQENLSLPVSPRRRSGGSSPRGVRPQHRTKDELSLMDMSKQAKDVPMRKLGRSSSVTDLDATMHREDLDAPTVEDPLKTPVVPPWMLDNMDFDRKYNSTEQLLEWLTRWAGRNHSLGLSHKSGAGDQVRSSQKSAIRISVPPRMILYSLWLLENVYYKSPVPSGQQEVVVAPVNAQYHLQPPAPQRGLSAEQIDGTLPAEEVQSTSDVSPRQRKDRKKKKQQRNKEEVPEMNTDQDGENRGRIKDTPLSAESAINPRRLDLQLSMTDGPEDSELADSQSESTLEVSSLKDDDLRRAMKETLTRLSSKRGQDLADTGASIDSSAMNATLRFPRDQDEPDNPGSDQGHVELGQGLGGDGSLLAKELQKVVRQELRSIMEAQHRGILALMGALDDPAASRPAAPPQQTQLANGHVPRGDGIPNGHVPRGDGIPNGHIPNGVLPNANVPQDGENQPQRFRNDCLVLTVQADVQPDLEKLKSRSSTDADATPLASELQSPKDKAMSVSELKEYTPQQHRPDIHVHGVLSELKQLEGQQGAPPQQHTPALQAPVNGKLDGDNEPRQVNHGFTGQSPEVRNNPPFLLRLQPERDHAPGSGPVRFPRIPLAPWQEGSAPVQPRPVPQMPVLTADSYQLPPQMRGYYSRHEVPERDTSAQSQPSAPLSQSGLPFPLLHIPSSRPVAQGSFPYQAAAPQLIPPEQIIKHEQRKHDQQMQKQKSVHDALRAVTDDQDASQVEPLGSKLIQADLRPWGPSDERTTQQRQKHRKRKEGEKKMKKNDRQKLKEDSESSTLSDPDHSQTLMPEGVLYVQPRGSKPDVSAPSLREGDTQTGSDSAERLHSGYALTPGMFDKYLEQQDELGAAVDTNAKLQYRAAIGVQTSPKRGIKKDAGTETVPGEADKYTSITKDTGTDPVSDAIQRYYRAKTGHTSTMLPPDVYMGLRFGDMGSTTQGESAEVGAQNSGRAFINVVDINSDMLSEIVSTVPERDQQHPKTQPDSIGLPVRQPLKAGSPVNQTTDAAETEANETRAAGPDQVTAGLLGGPAASTHGEMPNVDDLHRHSRLKTKDAIRQRLEVMNQQFNAIGTMNENMEEEFKNSNLLLHTIQHMAEAINPDKDRLYPQASVLDRLGAQDGHQGLPDEDQEHEVFQHMGALKPSAIKTFNRKDGQKAGETWDREKAGQQEVDQSVAAAADNHLELSGLSGVEDIVGEVLATGTLDLRQLGLSQRQADSLAQRARQAASDGVRLSNEELQTVFKAPAHQSKRSEDERKELQRYMEQKRAERKLEYKEKREQLREAEHAPYQPKEDSLQMSSTLNELQNFNRVRDTERKTKAGEDIERRKHLASQLMGDILADKPDLLTEMSPRATTVRKTTGKATKSLLTQTRTISPVRGETLKQVSTKKIVSLADFRKIRQRSKGVVKERDEDLDRMDVHARDYLHMRESYNSEHREQEPDAHRDPVQDRDGSPRATEYKPKSLADMVRLQRPEVTRGRSSRAQPVPYVERLAQMKGEGSTARSSPSTDNAQQKLYGTSRLPGSYKARERKAPRMVKTYTERLQEMKRARSNQPVISPPRRSRTWTQPESERAQPTERQPPRRQPGKPLTYAQQLQQLQPPKELYRTGEAPMRTVTLRKSQGPAHKAKTYAQQLQELQPPSKLHRADGSVTERKFYRNPPLRSLVRSRPYGNPYADLEDDQLSAVSPWSVDDEVKHMLYGDGASYVAPSTGAGDLDLSDITELDYMQSADYTHLVDVQELVDAVSVSSGSIMSFIDWDQVDRLISDQN